MSFLDVSRGLTIQPAKLTAYLLNMSHPQGGSKARFFIGRGFPADRPEALERALARHPVENAIHSNRTYTTSGGLSITTVAVRCVMTMADSSRVCIKTIWEVRPNQPPKLVTAYPA